MIFGHVLPSTGLLPLSSGLLPGPGARALDEAPGAAKLPDRPVCTEGPFATRDETARESPFSHDGVARRSATAGRVTSSGGAATPSRADQLKS